MTYPVLADRILRHMSANGPATVNGLAEVLGVPRYAVYTKVRALYVQAPRRLWPVGQRHDAVARGKRATLWFSSPSVPADFPVTRDGPGMPVAPARHASPPEERSPTAPSGVLWASLDWRLTNTELAKAAGCTRQGVAHVRARDGLPPPEEKSPLAPSGVAWSELDWGRSDATLAALAGCSIRTLRKWRHAVGKPVADCAPDGRPWDAQAWELADAEIARRLSVAVKTVAKRRRAHAPIELRRGA